MRKGEEKKLSTYRKFETSATATAAAAAENSSNEKRCDEKRTVTPEISKWIEATTNTGRGRKERRKRERK
jgi:hypothetical protein